MAGFKHEFKVVQDFDHPEYGCLGVVTAVYGCPDLYGRILWLFVVFGL